MDTENALDKIQYPFMIKKTSLTSGAGKTGQTLVKE